MAGPPASLLRDRSFALFVCARSVSVLGNGFGRVALAFGVLAQPGATATQLSIVLAAQTVPVVLLVLAGGVIADRAHRARVMVGSDLVASAAWSGLGAVVLAGRASVVVLAVLAAGAGTASALFFPASTGIVPQLVPAGRLQEANGVVRVWQNMALVVGLAVSGTVVALVGAGVALIVDAGSFLASAGLLAAVRLAPLDAPSRGPRSTSWSELRVGAREFFARQWLWVVVAQYALVVAATNANLGVLGPLVASRHLGGARAWSVIVAAEAAGTVLGAGVATRIRPGRPILVATWATFPAAIPLLLLAGDAPVWLIVVGMFAAGVSGDVFGVLWETTMQQQVPPEAISRVSAYDYLGSVAFAPIGILVAGPVAGVIGLTATLAVFAAVIVFATVGALASPDVRTLRASAPRG